MSVHSLEAAQPRRIYQISDVMRWMLARTSLIVHQVTLQILRCNNVCMSLASMRSGKPSAIPFPPWFVEVTLLNIVRQVECWLNANSYEVDGTHVFVSEHNAWLNWKCCEDTKHLPWPSQEHGHNMDTLRPMTSRNWTSYGLPGDIVTFQDLRRAPSQHPEYLGQNRRTQPGG